MDLIATRQLSPGGLSRICRSISEGWAPSRWSFINNSIRVITTMHLFLWQLCLREVLSSHCSSTPVEWDKYTFQKFSYSSFEVEKWGGKCHWCPWGHKVSRARARKNGGKVSCHCRVSSQTGKEQGIDSILLELQMMMEKALAKPQRLLLSLSPPTRELCVVV